MAHRYFNWKLAIVCLVALAVLGVGVFALHGWQKSMKAERALPLGEQAYAKEDWEQAADQLGRYLSVRGDDVPVLLKYAQAQLNIRPLKGDNVLQAWGAYVAVLRLDKANEEATHRLVDLCLNETVWRLADAEDRIRQYLEVKGDDPTLRRDLGEALFRQSKFREAAETLTQLIKDHPDEVLAYELLGDLAEERPDDANQPASGSWYDEAVKQNPDSALAYAIHALSRLRARDPNGAIADLHKAETLDLSDPKVHIRVAEELKNARLLDEARKHLEMLEATIPEELKLELWRDRAEVARLSGSAEEMEQVAQAGLKAFESNPWDFLPTAAELYIMAGQYDSAEDCIAQMHQKAVLPAYVAFLQGLLAQKRGQLSETVARWEEAVSLGYGPRVRLERLRLNLAAVLAQTGDLQSALAQLRALLADNSRSIDGHLLMARLSGMKGDWTAVADQARQVQQLDPGNADAVLLEMRSRIHLLAASTQATDQSEAWRQIERDLGDLDEASKGETRVRIKRLRFYVAMLQTKYSQASALLDELQAAGYSEVNVALLRSQLLLAQDKKEEAVALLRGTVAKFPQEVFPVRSLALLLNQLSRKEECESLVKQAVAGAQEPATQRQLGLLLADLYASWGQTDRIPALLTDLAAQFPDDIEIKRRFLILDSFVRDTPEAQKIVDQIKAIEGENGWQWRYEQAKVWFYSKDFGTHYADIVRLLKENLLARPDDQRSRLFLAAAYEKRGEFSLAVAAYREAYAASPDNIQVIAHLVRTLNQTGEAREAQRILDEAATRDIYDPGFQQLRLESQLRLGEWEPASATLEELVAEDPNQVSTSRTLASIFVMQKKFDEAQAILDRLKAQDPESFETSQLQVQLYTAQGDAEKAIALCDEVVKNRHDAQAYRLRARTYSQLRQPDKAIEDVQKALTLAGDDLTTQQLAVALFINSGKRSLINQAETLLDQALAAHPDDLDLKYSQARLLLLKDTAPADEQARRLLGEVTRERPRFVEAWELLGRLELRDNQPGRAVDAALGGLAYSPQDKRLLLLKAQGEAQRSSEVQAIPTLEALAQQDPNDVDVAIQLSSAYVKSERPEQAIQLLQRRIGTLKGTDRRRCEIALAATWYQSGQTDKAMGQFRTLMAAEPNDPVAVLTLAQLLGTSKNWAELRKLMDDWALKHPKDSVTATAVGSLLFSNPQGGPQAREMAEDILRSALQRNPTSAGTLYVLAILLQTSGRNSEAADMNRRVIQADPNNVIAMNNLAWLLCEDQKKYSEALQLADKGLRIAPDYRDLIDTRGVIYYRMGSYQEAVRDLNRCIELCSASAGAPLLAQSHFHLGRVYLQMGRKTEALQQISRALELQGKLDQQDRSGGLSREDQMEAKRLLDQLQGG
jgi:tetratricopeptide (TPR) repeat protein